jgi:hypothetical protein
MVAQVGYSVAGRSRGRVTPCAVKIKVDNLSVVEPQNHWDDYLQFGLKTGGDDFSRFSLKIGDKFLG